MLALSAALLSFACGASGEACEGAAVVLEARERWAWMRDGCGRSRLRLGGEDLPADALVAWSRTQLVIRRGDRLLHVDVDGSGARSLGRVDASDDVLRSLVSVGGGRVAVARGPHEVDLLDGRVVVPDEIWRVSLDASGRWLLVETHPRGAPPPIAETSHSSARCGLGEPGVAEPRPGASTTRVYALGAPDAPVFEGRAHVVARSWGVVVWDEEALAVVGPEGRVVLDRRCPAPGDLAAAVTAPVLAWGCGASNVVGAPNVVVQRLGAPAISLDVTPTLLRIGSPCTTRPTAFDLRMGARWVAVLDAVEARVFDVATGAPVLHAPLARSTFGAPLLVSSTRCEREELDLERGLRRCL